MSSIMHKCCGTLSQYRTLISMGCLWGGAFLFWCCSWYVMHWIGRYVGLGFNFTASEPRGIYLYVRAARTLSLGERVDFLLTQSQMQRVHGCIKAHQWGLKYVGAVPGEWLFTKNRAVYACRAPSFNQQCRYLGRCLPSKRLGALVHCQRWVRYQIPNAQYYMMSQLIPNSCDSRYFGLVSRAQIHHRLSLWWLFS